jgi:hypothetical protein
VSYTIADESPKRAAALRFAAEFARALKERNVGWRQLNVALGKDVHSLMDRYKTGRLLPKVGQAAMLAEALEWPKLLEIVREYRTSVCPIDGRMFVNDGGNVKKYCSDRCRDVGGVQRAKMNGLVGQEAKAYALGDPERAMVARIKQELVGSKQERRQVSSAEIRDAIKQWESTSSHSRHRRLKNELDRHLMSVERMCRECEPEGICRNSDCPLRSVSPLPYVPMADVELAREKAPPGKSADPDVERERRRQHTLRMLRRHSEPGNRERASARSRSWWQSMTPEQRVEHARRIAEARQKGTGGGIRDCGCTTRKHRDDCPLRQEALA